MGKMKKKFESGEATLYMTRKVALRKLQLSLKMFRRLCILKGIYPREPKNRKRAQKGSTEKKTLYLKKDIQFLLHEPIVWKLRDHKVYIKKKRRAIALREYDNLKRIIESKPTYRLDHIIKERYPTFIDAIRDLDDCLTLVSLFATFPSSRFFVGATTKLCQRLFVEFLHYVIEAKALRKVFISIKGYYYQAEIKGQTVTWIVPHKFGYQPQSPDDVDFRIMSTFLEFYTTLLGFINFRLYHSVNLCYPPILTTVVKESSSGEDKKDIKKELASEEEFLSERVAALNQSLLKTCDAVEEEGVPEIDEFSTQEGEDPAKSEEIRREAERIKRLKSLFEGKKFYLGREVPREPLTFLIRAFGGIVSWDKLLFPGATFDEDDEKITHHIVDKNGISDQRVSRYYIQPQWVFDSVNASQCLPIEIYFPGAVLPPHVSPFRTEREGDYVPPEKKKFIDLEKGLIMPNEWEKTEDVEDGDEEDDDDDEEDDEAVNAEEEEEESSEEEMDISEIDKKRKKLKKQMKVETGKVEEVDPTLIETESKEEHRLRVMMVKNRHKRLYKKMMESRGKRRKEADKLTSKRKSIEQEEKAKKKANKKGSPRKV